MADIGDTTTQIKAHQATFSGFTQMMTWGTVAAALVAAFVVFMIAS
jgi:hypothetical protein